MSRPICAQINLAALRHNLTEVKKLTPNSKIWAVIKANGYGHGIERVARQLSPADGFAVASLDEALILRQKGFIHRILLLEGVFKPDELPLVEQHRLDMVIHSEHQLDWVLEFECSVPLNVWIKVDTGMHRLGFDPELVDQVLTKLRHKLPNSNFYFMSHFSCSDENDQVTLAQLDVFNTCCKHQGFAKSFANSAAVQAFPNSHFDWVRPGIMLYGAGILPDLIQRFKPVLTFKTEIISLKWIPNGDAVGYGQTWKAPRRSLIGVAAAGYGDGYPRHAPSGTPVLVNGKRVELVGRVSMDMITLDLTDMADHVAIGDSVTLWGEGLSVDEVANKAGTIGYELLCGITQRVPIIEV
jgi:alanine racemase